MLGMTQPNFSRLERGEQEFTEDLMTRIAAALGVEPVDLLPMAVVAGLKNDIVAAPVNAEPGVVAVLQVRGLVGYRVITNAVANAGIEPGRLIIVDTLRRDVATFKDGELIAAIVRNPERPHDSFTVLRQFRAPHSLATNKPKPSADTTFRIDDDWILVEIVGAVVPDHGSAAETAALIADGGS
jgi:transcriptional regulator with XRE-family HTH domain